jgi:5'(3')-deoxyribonucleotidase
MKTIYLDMDGVIANFDKDYYSIFGVNCRDDPDKGNWNKFISLEGFKTLSMMPDAQVLLDYLQSNYTNIIILSCAGRKETYTEVCLQKIKWLENNKIGHLPRAFTFTKKEKGLFGHPSCILIDDSIQCIEPFVQNNGNGALHTSAVDTINQLQGF